MAIDPKKPVMTRDGRPARIICTDRIGNAPIIALVNRHETEFTVAVTAEGRVPWSTGSHESDLINIPAKRTGWVNVYRTGGEKYIACVSNAYATRAKADQSAAFNRIACVEIEWEE